MKKRGAAVNLQQLPFLNISEAYIIEIIKIKQKYF